MGAFFTNIQILLRGRAPDRARRYVREALIQCLTQGEARYTLVDDQEAADRSIALAAGPQGPWVSVCDQATEDQGPELAALTRRLSDALNTPAISVLVHDSDVLELRLFDQGTPVDTFLSDPDYFGERSAEARQASAGAPDRWASALVPGAEPRKLAAVWSEEHLFAEEHLDRIGPLLGWDTRWTRVGFNSLDPTCDGALDWLHLCHTGATHDG